ncbi:unnamed protein product [Thlaspi arvense]|uniref:Uncharacterized protein n=1 Tax=Thlaspi arvense TaxID=13288 RepID=A0AAU9T9U2_THLAR|nr:unnamed protein product [Thlaspi arvense]
MQCITKILPLSGLTELSFRKIRRGRKKRKAERLSLRSRIQKKTAYSQELEEQVMDTTNTPHFISFAQPSLPMDTHWEGNREFCFFV